MPTHITARIAWHSDGWNGHVCKAPERNTYCVGCKSFPGDVIARERNIDVERKFAGKHSSELGGYVPPCSYSYNAFGVSQATAASEPPDFFYGGAARREWTLEPATVSVWSYEAMYDDQVKASGRLDNDMRQALARKFFEPVIEDCGENLVFHYANYSNPLSEDENQRYLLVGVSRITKVGEELFYENVQEKIAKDYAGGMVWARDITTAYPNEGLRLPYHLYLDDPQTLASIAVFPENPALCKYGSKHLTDDDAIGLLEQFLAKVEHLEDIGDKSENWTAREDWLKKTIASLWASRGLYPGLLRALDAAGAEDLIPAVKSLCTSEGHIKAHAEAFAALESDAPTSLTAALTEPQRRKIARNWKLRDDGERLLLKDVLPRFSLSADVMRAISSNERARCGLDVSAAEISENPYLISERFCGEGPEDRISWSTVDRGVLPSPDVGGDPMVGVELNDARRFRALCVEHLRNEPNHTFRLSRDLIVEVLERMRRLPEWKGAEFTERYFEVDAEFLSGALTLRGDGAAGLAVYLKSTFEDERLVERTLVELAGRPDITLRRPVTAADWKSWVLKADSQLALKGGADYLSAVEEQIGVCSRLFRRPFAVVTGQAGTGKTTVIEAIVRGIRRTEGEGAEILVLAPTGKAADRAREVFENASLERVKTVTVHSFLASFGWLNENLTFRRAGGKSATPLAVVLDEGSMLDLELAAALMRAIDWRAVHRLILVGDAGQLPPIGRGRLFADVVRWLSSEHPDSLGRLNRNLRQLLNKTQNTGSAIIELANLFVVDDEEKSADAGEDSATTLAQEELIARVHAGGAVDQDLNIIYWDRPEDLSEILLTTIETRMSGGAALSDTPPYKVWQEALKSDPTAYQILTPHRGELHGVEALNAACQKRIAAFTISRVGAVDGITLFDKVIQIRNRPASNKIWAYDHEARSQVEVEVFNGEIGMVRAIGFDSKLYTTLKTGYGPRLSRFAVQFSRKQKFAVGYGKNVPYPGDRRRQRRENVEENLELAYAVSVHKAQGSEFAHTFIVVPSGGKRSVSTELIYTALTRASRHCTLLIERDVSSLLDARRRENAQMPQINSWLFDNLHVGKEVLRDRRSWYEAGKIHQALSGVMVRSKSEVIIANLLHNSELPFSYEMPLFAGDGTLRLPDFTLSWRGRTYYWEHLGMLDQTKYADDWSKKQKWYDEWFPGQLVTTEEAPNLSGEAADIIEKIRAQ